MRGGGRPLRSRLQHIGAATGARRPLALAGIAAGLVAVAVGVWGLTSVAAPAPRAASASSTGSDDTISVPPTASAAAGKVELDPGTPTEAPSAAKAVADTGDRFEVDSVDLDVPLGAINQVGGVLTPPGFTSAYWVRNLGVAPQRSRMGTVFVVMHATRGGDGSAPGNLVSDIADQRSRVKVGATVEVAGVSYRVTGSSSVDRATLSTDAAVWANTPNRLVIITCLERANRSAPVDNLVITATRV